MVPQGLSVINVTQFNNLKASIEGASSCEELQKLVAEALGSLAATKAAITAELAAVQPILALLQAPGGSFGSIVGWITGFITNVLTPMVKPNITYAAQLTQLAAQIAELTSAINSVSARFPSCTVTPPSI